MAEEARRNGGRNEPLAADDWKPGKRRSKSKPFGLKISYDSVFWRAGKTIQRRGSWTQWYATERDRDTAEKAFLAGRSGFNHLTGRLAEKLER
jgi:hypothetical protein